MGKPHSYAGFFFRRRLIVAVNSKYIWCALYGAVLILHVQLFKSSNLRRFVALFRRVSAHFKFRTKKTRSFKKIGSPCDLDYTDVATDGGSSSEA